MADVLDFAKGVRVLRGLPIEHLRQQRLAKVKRLADLGLVGKPPPRWQPPRPPSAA